jgi:uncharacterized protein
VRVDPNGRLIFAATDLSNFLSCRHKTTLELDVALGRRKRPHDKDDLTELLRERGLEHEERYVDAKRAAGRTVVSLAHLDYKQADVAVAHTLEAMRAGAELIAQGALFSTDGRWGGRPDVLYRVQGQSALGSWHYEAVDTKLACETRGATILQLGLYSTLLADVQKCAPVHFHVVTPVAEESYRVSDFSAYSDLVRRQLETFVESGDATYPDPVGHCDVCAWWQECALRLRADDHLSFVAGITRLQRRELNTCGITTLEALGTSGLPTGFVPSRESREAYARAAEQARLQWQTRTTGAPAYELLSVVGDDAARIPEGVGLARLPEPSAADIFLDLEGSAFARGLSLGGGEGNREYLFGVVTLDASGAPVYQSFWAHDDAEERRAFETVIDLVMRAWERNAGMHVYHYAPYEPTAMKRLMGRYSSRAAELDRLLRGGRFVDLYAVVRQGLRAGVEKYSIKNLETFYGYARAIDLRDAGARLRIVEHHLELGMPGAIGDDDRRIVRGYNEDDCRSTFELRNWLEARRAELEASGVDVPRPLLNDGNTTDDKQEEEAKVEALRTRLLEGVPADRASHSSVEHARFLLAYMLDFHRREDKASWWEFFRLRDLPQEDYLDEPGAIGGLRFDGCLGSYVGPVSGKATSSVLNRYVYDVQDMEIRPGDGVCVPTTGKKVGTVEAVDRIARTIVLKQGKQTKDLRLSAVFEHTYFNPATIEASIVDLASNIGFDLDTGRSHLAARDLLLRRPPRLKDGVFAAAPEETPVEFAVRLGLSLDRTTLAIQGPPGTGKTFTGAEMICALVKARRKVGVVANSHKVIINLLDAARKAAARKDMPLRIVRKDGEENAAGDIPVSDDIDGIRAALDSRAVDVVGGTKWLWASVKMIASVDVLFVDEAGQMSLADVLGASRAAGSLVLLGDPRQLDQPRKGSHPDGVHVSALDHVLDGAETMPSDRGVFLPTTWRLAPSICTFTSETFYEGRLDAREELANQRLEGDVPFKGAGLWMVPVAHSDNQTSSREEIDVVERIVRDMLTRGVTWTDPEGKSSVLTADDFRVIAPYNAQVSRLAERLALLGVPVGTVDKFQGQEAPVVIYSMTTSRPEDAPRGLEFLYSLNRLNVATSRARCAAIVVASPELFEPDCHSPGQMRLANAFCRLKAMATVQRVAATEAAGHVGSTPDR